MCFDNHVVMNCARGWQTLFTNESQLLRNYLGSHSNVLPEDSYSLTIAEFRACAEHTLLARCWSMEQTQQSRQVIAARGKTPQNVSFSISKRLRCADWPCSAEDVQLCRRGRKPVWAWHDMIADQAILGECGHVIIRQRQR